MQMKLGTRVGNVGLGFPILKVAIFFFFFFFNFFFFKAIQDQQLQWSQIIITAAQKTPERIA